MKEFITTDCPYCGDMHFEVNLDTCLICGKYERACRECLSKHRGTHTAAEIEAFTRDMMQESELTPREQINLELKQQIRQQAETLCKLIDDQESLVQKYESQCRVLSEEVDRLRPAS